MSSFRSVPGFLAGTGGTADLGATAPSRPRRSGESGFLEWGAAGTAGPLGAVGRSAMKTAHGGVFVLAPATVAPVSNRWALPVREPPTRTSLRGGVRSARRGVASRAEGN